KAFRDYDGKGARFLDVSLPAKATGSVSMFASRDVINKRLVLVALNTDPSKAATGPISLDGCGSVVEQRTFQTTFGPRGLEPVKSAKIERAVLPPYSITVFEVQLGDAEPKK